MKDSSESETFYKFFLLIFIYGSKFYLISTNFSKGETLVLDYSGSELDILIKIFFFMAWIVPEYLVMTLSQGDFCLYYKLIGMRIL